MTIDPTTPIGQIRLRTADYNTPVFLPDSVYQATLDQQNGSIPKASVIIAQYILGMLSMKTHRKLQQLEVWGAEAFTNYRQFLMDTIDNPNSIRGISPIPYAGVQDGCEHPLIKFTKDWNANYAAGTQSEQLAYDANRCFKWQI